MSGTKGNKPHKKNHKGCIGWIYCKRLDKTFGIGDQASIPDKTGYRCDCGRYTRLDPFKHEVHYYDEDNIGQPGYVYDNDICRLKTKFSTDGNGSCDKKGKSCQYGNKVWHACEYKKEAVRDLGFPQAESDNEW